MKLWVAILLAIVGGAIAAYTTILLIAGAMLGVLWLWVFGDDVWPTWVTKGFEILIPVGGLILWAIFGGMIWARIKRELPTG